MPFRITIETFPLAEKSSFLANGDVQKSTFSVHEYQNFIAAKKAAIASSKHTVA